MEFAKLKDSLLLDSGTEAPFRYQATEGVCLTRTLRAKQVKTGISVKK